MNTDTGYQYVERSGIMSGMRGQFPPVVALEVTRVLLEEGINVFEFTMNSFQPLEAMQAVKKAYGDDACVGMGTVLDAAMARQALDAGAENAELRAFLRSKRDALTETWSYLWQPNR